MESPGGEKIKVGAVFDGNLLKPKWFIYGGMRREVKEINYNWKSKKGETVLSYFSVSDGTATYLLSFNHTTLKWTLERVYAD